MCFENLNIDSYNGYQIKSFLSEYCENLNFNQFAIKPVSRSNSIINVIYNAIKNQECISIIYENEYNSKNIKLKPISIFEYKDKIYLEGIIIHTNYLIKIKIENIKDANPL